MTNVLSVREATWANIGTDVKQCKNNIDEILVKSGLDYNVVEQPVFIGGGDAASDRFKAIVRESDGHVYNITKKSYTICQNRDAFAFLEEMPEDLEIVKAGESGSGMIYLIGVLPTLKVLGDDFTPHLIFQTSHNADFALKTAIAPLRVVCQNQFNTAFGDNSNAITLKHTPGIAANVHEAGRILRGTSEYMQYFAKKADMLATNKVNVEKAIEILLPISKDATEASANRVEEAREVFRGLYNTSDNQNFRGSAWGLLNAVTDYSTHETGKKSAAENRFVASIISPDFQKKAVALINSGIIAA